MKYLSTAVVAIREVPSSWELVFGCVPHIRKWMIGYFTAGIAAIGLIEVSSFRSSAYSNWYLLGAMVFAASATCILAGDRWVARAKGRQQYGVPLAALADIWRHATEERANRFACLMDECGQRSIAQVACWVEENHRAEEATRFRFPQWAITMLFIPLTAAVTIATQKLQWVGVLLAAEGILGFVGLWLIGTAWGSVAHGKMRDLEHVVKLALIRNSCQTPPLGKPV